MKREFIKHGLVYGAANLISSVGSILLVPLYTHALRPAEYGVIDYLTVVQSLVQIGAGLEITQGIARFYSAAGSEGDRRAYASTGLWFMLASFVTVCLALYVAARLFGAQFLGVEQESTVLALALLAVFTRILFYALQSQARWELRSDLYSIASLIGVTCSVGGVAYFLFVRQGGIAGVFAGLSIGYGIGCAFCLVVLRHTYRWLFDGSKLREMLRFSLPLTISSLALFIANYGDRIILKSALGFHELGIYGIAARFAAVITLAINGFQLGAAPLIYRHYGQPETPASLAQLMRLFLFAGLVGVLGLSAFSIELVQLFATPEYTAAWRVIPVLAFAMVMANMYIFVPGLTLRNMTTRFAMISVANGAVALLLIAAFVRVLGVNGAAVAVLCSASFGFAMHAICSQRVYKIPIPWSRLIGGLAVTATAIGATSALAAPGVTSLGLRLVLFAVGSLALMAMLSTRDERALAQRLAVSGATSSWGHA